MDTTENWNVRAKEQILETYGEVFGTSQLEVHEIGFGNIQGNQ